MSSLAARVPLPTHALHYAAYAAMHVACLAVFWIGFSWSAILICAGSYLLRMFGLVAGYHRYFAHKSYRMGRTMQFGMALLGTLAVQKGVLWWSEYHRHHHRFPDEPEDVHSPLIHGFLYSHSGWFLDPKNSRTDPSTVPDLASYRELRWLNDWNHIPIALYALALFLLFSWEGLVWGFFVSTVLIWHAIHAVGSFGHRIGGYRRYPTLDNSRNNWLLALLTLGEGWHNNHHYFPASTRQGHAWYELDVAFYGLKLLSWFGLVHDLKDVPDPIRNGELLPSAHQRLVAFRDSVVELRRDLNAVLDRASEPGSEGRRPEGVADCRQSMADRIDALDEAAPDLLLAGPIELRSALDEMREELVEAAMRALGPHLVRESVGEGIRAGIDSFASRCRVIGPATT